MVALKRSTLSEAVTWVASFLPPRPTVPILSGLRISATGSNLIVEAYDYEVAAGVMLPFEGQESWRCVVPGALFAQILKGVSGQFVQLALTDDGLAWMAGRSSGTIHLLSEDEYPTLPQKGKAQPFFTANREALTLRVSSASAFCGESDWQVGILLENRKDGTFVKAGSRYALQRSKVAASSGGLGAALVPARTLEKAMKMPGEVIDVLYDNAANPRIWFQSSTDSGTQWSLTTPTIALEFPMVAALFDVPSSMVLTPESTTALVDAAKSISLVSNAVELVWDDVELDLRAAAPYGGAELLADADSTVMLQEQVDAGSSTIQTQYLLSALKGLSDSVVMEYRDQGQNKTWKIRDGVVETVIMALKR